ncbi:MAG: class II aldolase/adducin family protein [Anaerolineae bacterium]|nr:class II aldolase/adducin family protein [Anaerolineae bacterium]
MTHLEYATAQRSLQDAGKYLLANELTWGNSGNLSTRVGPERFLITATGAFLGNLDESDFVECAFDGSYTHPQGRRPSKEAPMHHTIYALRPEINAVLHASPLHSTLVSAAQMAAPSDWFVEGMYYLERVARVPYCHPGSAALAEAVRAQALTANVLLLENHGVLVYDTNIQEALAGLHTLELACRMALLAHSAALPMRPVAPEQVADFLEHSGYRPRRRWLTEKR